jgi:hypothetical protein
VLRVVEQMLVIKLLTVQEILDEELVPHTKGSQA